MKKPRLAIIGLGNLGRKCAEAILADPAMVLAGVVRRSGNPASWLKAPVVTHISELKEVDAALVCVPPDAVIGIVKDLLQNRIRVVECARLHGEAFLIFIKFEGVGRVSPQDVVGVVVPEGADVGFLDRFGESSALDLFAEPPEVLGPHIEQGGIAADVRRFVPFAGIGA